MKPVVATVKLAMDAIRLSLTLILALKYDNIKIQIGNLTLFSSYS